MTDARPTLWTIGHSTRTFDALADLLTAHGVRRLVDVRLHPGSRRYPHFKSDALAVALPARGVEYLHAPAPGGRRKPRPDSPNTAWRNDAFRGYADYMATPAFGAALAELEAGARGAPTAIMCSEAVWWRCHRGLISDALKVRGWRVLHIEDCRASKEHPYTGAARLADGRLTYDAREGVPAAAPKAGGGGLFG
jgi:uncharacterized protein (DUF488 family)